VADTHDPNPRPLALAIELIAAHLSTDRVRQQARAGIYEELSASAHLHADVTNTLAVLAARLALDAASGDVATALQHLQKWAIQLRSGFEE
jgi:hypothetical protein